MAYLLCLDRYLAEDRCWLDERRRPWRRRERQDGVVPEAAGAGLDPAVVTATDGLSERLLRALAGIGPRQRAVVVMRFGLDLPIALVTAL